MSDPSFAAAQGRALSVKIVESRRARQGTLVFLAGFPDTHNVFLDTLVPGLAEDYRCVVACLPDYDQPRLNTPFGYSTAEIVTRLNRTIAAASPSEPITLVLHDWGCIYGLAWASRYPTQVRSLVALDVFSHDVVRTAFEQSPSELFWVLLYQAWLAGASYVRSWVERLLGHAIKKDPTTSDYPILFAYGTHKRVRFHSTAVARDLARDPRHRVIAYACGHWVQYAEARALTGEIKLFLELCRINKTCGYTAAPEACPGNGTGRFQAL